VRATADVDYLIPRYPARESNYAARVESTGDGVDRT
jgi:hypothetical protein